MDADRFLRELPAAVEDAARFAELLEVVPGLAKPKNLALLNHAASCLQAGESYLEIGTYRGTSLIAAMLGNRGDFVALDNWSLEDGSREQLDANLARYDLHAMIVEGDAFKTLASDVLAGRTMGVFYYDNGHAYDQQRTALRLVETYLARDALMIVDDTDWETVARAVDDYLDEQPRATEIFRVEGSERGHPEWWEGMRVLRWGPR